MPQLVALVRRLLTVPALIAALSRLTGAQASSDTSPVPALAADDRVRIAEAFRVAETLGDGLWAGWSRVPMALLLVTSDREYLLRHPRPSNDFTRISYDSLLATDVFTRPRMYDTKLLATFPAVGGIPTIVIGRPSTTSKSSTAWVLTVLHEHFHQMQMSHPGYNAGVTALNLARSDQTGMWMLNYAFPYDSLNVQGRFADFSDKVLRAFNAPAEAAKRLPEILASRDQLQAALAADDARYLSFQMWQEGVARYTELVLARRAAASYMPSPAFKRLPDFTSFDDERAVMEESIRASLQDNPLRRLRRVAFYAAGAAYAQVLQATTPNWPSTYWNSALQLTGSASR